MQHLITLLFCLSKAPGGLRRASSTPILSNDVELVLLNKYFKKTATSTFKQQ